ncbi:MAG: glycosyltransferase [Phycisphaerales bacterium]|nr:MAG: glycosyltransferase [Phycisphaerales bacterium]
MNCFTMIASEVPTLWSPLGIGLEIGLGIVLATVYLGALAVASIYGLHRYWLVVRYYRTRHRAPIARQGFDQLPHVTVQLPMFNESAVAGRIIDATCALDYPRDRLQIQVLDDSTDECASITRDRVASWRERGISIEHLHRTDRIGYKAGALQAGLATATGEFIAVFDADFLPPRDFLMQTVPHFSDDAIGMVQAAWDHLNREDSLLTRCQAMYLDSHFQIEHAARNRDGNWFNFNGTAGIWRREAIETAGGWQHDTLTEDMDLSYRAQLVGWEFTYLQNLPCPAEVPPTIRAFKTQQHRWTKGTVQTAMKLLPRILKSNAAHSRKLEAMFHLTSPLVYPCVLLIALLMLPAVALQLRPFEHGSLSAGLFGLMILLLATASGVTFYVAGQIERRIGLLRTLGRVPALIALGVGMSVNNALAVVEALLKRESGFVRTPKFNAGSGHSARITADTSGEITSGRLSRQTLSIAIELLLGTYLLICLAWSFTSLMTIWTAPFLAIFAAGYLSVGLSSIRWSALFAPRDAASLSTSPHDTSANLQREPSG